MTGETVTSATELKEQLADIATTGIANERDEAEALTRDMVRDAARAISQELGATSWPTTGK
jgi:hypothetical protein